jgi:hypothetical protein
MKSNDLSNLLIGQDRKSRNGSNRTEPPEELLPKSASLLDDTLSDKKKKTNWKTPIWIALLVIAASVFAMYLSGPDEADRAEAARKAEASRNPALLEKLVNEAKVAESGGNGLQAEPLRQNNSGAPETAATINKTPAKINPAPQPPPAVKKPTPVTPAASSAQTPAGTQTAAAEQDRPENMPQLIRDVKKNDPPAEVAAPAQETAPQLNSNQESFDYLEKNSAVAAKLINGGFSNLSYSNWKVIRETSQEVWIDIEAAWTSGGPAIHHIWSVDMDNGKIRALSQAARNLEALKN